MPSPAYRALSGYTTGTGSTVVATGGRTLGLEFSVAEFSWLSTVWYYRVSTSVALPTAAGVWTVTAGATAAATVGALIPGSSAVTWVATVDQVGWIPGVLSTPILLAPGLIFRIGALASGTVPANGNYYSTGAGAAGFSSGPLRVPGSSTAVNGAQGVYNVGSSLAFPATAGTANYGIDVTVEPDPDLIQGTNDSANPACAADGTGWAPYNSSSAAGGRATDLTGMAKTTGWRMTRISTVGDAGVFAGPPAPVTVGETVSISAEMKTSVAVTGARVYFWGLDAAGQYATLLGSTPNASLAANTPGRIGTVVTVPSGVASFRPLPYVNGAPANCIVEVTAVRIRRGSWAVLGYIDGDTPKCVWDGIAGKSTSRRNPKVWAADTDSSAVATVGTSIGYTGTQRQDGSGVFVSGPSAVPVEAAPFGRPGRASRIDIATGYQRIEQNPDHRTFAAGEDYWFGFAFSLAAGFPTWVDDFWVIEQLHGAPGTGSPVLAFETRGYALRMSGGANRPGASTPGQYAYDKLILPNLRVNRWYHVIYHVSPFSDQPGGSLVDVWVDGVSRLTGFAPPCGTVYGVDIAPTDGGNTYRKQGAYKRPALEGGTIRHAGAALGTSYAAVDPTRTQLVATSDSMAPAFC